MGQSFEQWMRARRYSDQTVRVYLIYTRKAAAHCDLDTATTSDLEDFIETLPDTAPSKIAARKALTLYYTAAGGRNPAADLPRVPEPHRLPRPLSEDGHLRWVAAAHELGGLHRAAGLLMATTGTRIGEVREARWKEVHLADRGSYWRVRGKGAKRRGPKLRDVDLHPVVVEILRDWRVPGPYLFPGRNGPLSDPAMRTVLVEIGEHAGLGYVVPHRIRHSVASWIVDQTGNIKLAAELLGHASSATTDIYSKIRRGRLKEAVEILPV